MESPLGHDLSRVQLQAGFAVRPSTGRRLMRDLRYLEEVTGEEARPYLERFDRSLGQLERVITPLSGSEAEDLRDAVERLATFRREGRVRCWRTAGGLIYASYDSRTDQIRLHVNFAQATHPSTILHEAIHAVHGRRYPRLARMYGEALARGGTRDRTLGVLFLQWKAWTEYWAYRRVVEYRNALQTEPSFREDAHASALAERDVRRSIAAVRAETGQDFDPSTWSPPARYRAREPRGGRGERRPAVGAEAVPRRHAAGPEPDAVPPIVHEVVGARGEPLDAATRAFMEPRFGWDFGEVRIHSDARAAASAAAVNAHAYTVGCHVVFASQQFAPASPEGRRLLAHELTHVVQQHRSGAGGSELRILPPGTEAEAEAEQAAAHIASGGSAGLGFPPVSGGLQRDMWGREQDPIHGPLIEDYRRRHGLPPGGVDESGRRFGPSDAEIKYQLLPAEAAPPPCPEVQVIRSEDFSDPAVRQAFLDVNCISESSRAMRPACRFTRRQEQLLAAAQRTAAARIQRGLDRVGAGAVGRRFAAELAGQLFTHDPPTVAEVIARLRPVREFLAGSSVRFAGRTCGDETCQRSAVVAYVDGAGQLPIYICPTAFSQGEGLHRTVLHEALHWSGLDADPATPEGYCERFDCQTPCLTQNDADGWTHYLDCLGEPIRLRQDFRQEIIESVRDLP